MASAKGIDPKLKNLKIKTGVVKRLAKEKIMYEKEVVDQEAKIEKMKAENKDEYDIKKQVEVLQESKNMVPDCQRRLERAIADLKATIEDCGEFKDSEVYTTATEQLEAVSSS